MCSFPSWALYYLHGVTNYRLREERDWGQTVSNQENQDLS